MDLKSYVQELRKFPLRNAWSVWWEKPGDARGVSSDSFRGTP